MANEGILTRDDGCTEEVFCDLCGKLIGYCTPGRVRWAHCLDCAGKHAPGWKEPDPKARCS